MAKTFYSDIPNHSVQCEGKVYLFVNGKFTSTTVGDLIDQKLEQLANDSSTVISNKAPKKASKKVKAKAKVKVKVKKKAKKK